MSVCRGRSLRFAPCLLSGDPVLAPFRNTPNTGVNGTERAKGRGWDRYLLVDWTILRGSPHTVLVIPTPVMISR